MILFKSEYINDANSVLSNLSKVANVNLSETTQEKEVTFSGKNIHILDESIAILSGFTNPQKDIPDFIVDSALRRAIFAVQKQESHTLKDLEKLMHFEINKFTKISKKKFHLVASLSVSTQKKFIKTIEGTRICITNKLPKNMKLDIQQAIHKNEDFKPSQYTYVIVSGYARLPLEAGENLLKYLDFFRSLLNFHYFLVNRGERTFYSGEIEPYNKILTGKYQILFDENGLQYNDRWWYVPDWKNINLVKNIKSPDNLKKLFDKVLSLKKSSQLYPMIKESLLQFNAALDHTDRDLVVEKLWLPLEILTSTSGRKETKDKTIDRTVAIFTTDKERHRMVLQRAMDLRNRYVHAGVTNRSADDIAYLMKNRVESLLNFTIFNAHLFSTKEEMTTFLDYLKDQNSYIKLIRIQSLMKKFKIFKTTQL